VFANYLTEEFSEFVIEQYLVIKINSRLRLTADESVYIMFNDFIYNMPLMGCLYIFGS